MCTSESHSHGKNGNRSSPPTSFSNQDLLAPVLQFLDRFDDSDLENPLAQLVRADAQQSISALYEYDAKASNDGIVVARKEENTKITNFLLASFVEWLCQTFDSDTGKQKHLYTVMSHYLSELRIVPSVYFSDEMHSIRDQFRLALSKLINQAQLLAIDIRNDATEQFHSPLMLENSNFALARSNFQRSTSLPSPYVLLHAQPAQGYAAVEMCRYAFEFEQLGVVGRGGFGQVFKVRNKLDGCHYAVKQIRFDITDAALCFKVLREVRLLAKLKHPNIVRYYNSWLEFELGPAFVRRRRTSSHVTKGGVNIEELSDHKSVVDGESVTNCSHLPSGLRRNFSTPDISFVASDGGDGEHADTEHLGSWSTDDVFERNLRESVSWAPPDADVNNAEKELSVVPAQYMDEVHANIKRFMPMTRSLVLYLQMDLCTLTLRDWLNRRNAMSARSKNAYFGVDPLNNQMILKQTLRAVEYIHAQGLIHRDIKPSNLFLHEQPELRVMMGDFGLACRVESSGEGSTASFHSAGVGTLTYSAPEQITSNVYDNKVDVYSVGVVAYELYQPFQTYMEKIQAIMQLRNGTLEQGFLQRWPVEAAFILQLVQHNPTLRPSARTLLESAMFVSKSERIRILEDRITTQAKEIEKLKAKLSRCKCRRKPV